MKYYLKGLRQLLKLEALFWILFFGFLALVVVLDYLKSFNAN